MTRTTTPNKAGRSLPILRGILPIDRSRVPLDIIAGVTLATLAIPEVMGYTKIAGMPVVTGLNTILIPMTLYALFGSSRHLVVGADSATAAIMAAGLVGLASPASPGYVAYAGILALMAAFLLGFARIVRLGFIADFLSRTVLIGFLTGVGIQVALGQISGMLGVPGGGVGAVQPIVTALKQLGQTKPYAIAVSLATVVIVVGCRGINKRIPGALIAVVGAIAVSYLTGLSSYGVAVLGTVAGGLPKLGLPAGVTLNASVLGQLLPTAFSMFIVILAQSSATARAYATRYGESFSENTDLVGLGLANIGAGLSGTFVVNGSPTKTEMVDRAGGRSQIAMLTTAAITVLVLLFLTKPLAYLPEAALSSVVFLIGVGLIDVKGMYEILAQRPAEFWVASVTALAVILVGVQQGIILAIVVSVFSHTRHGYKPKNAVLAVDKSGTPHMLPVSSQAQAVPGLVVYRFNHSMYFANAERFSQEVLGLVDSAQPPVSWFCIDLTAVDDVDFSAAATLREVCKRLKQRGIRLVLAEVDQDVRDELDRSDLTALIGTDAYFETVGDVQAVYVASVPNNGT